MRTFEIEISPRIHLGLISMHAGAPRKNGGLGFAIDSPKASVRAEPAKDFELLDQRPKPMPDEEVAALRGRLSEVQSQLKLPQAARIVIRGDFLTHYGMGSGTAIRLACIEGLLAINRQIPSREELVKLSGRGGTSGVGIATYFDGGFLFDLGVPSEGLNEFAPSSAASNVIVPLRLCRQSFPHWPLGLCLPRKCRPKNQQEEIEFFRRATPLSANKSHEAAYVAVFGVLAALLSEDYPSFCRSVDAMQECEWKKLERAEYSPHLEATDLALRDLGVDCVGMSSLGPMLFFFASTETLQRVWDHRNSLDADIVLTTPKNSGRRFSEV